MGLLYSLCNKINEAQVLFNKANSIKCLPVTPTEFIYPINDISTFGKPKEYLIIDSYPEESEIVEPKPIKAHQTLFLNNRSSLRKNLTNPNTDDSIMYAQILAGLNPPKKRSRNSR